MKLSAGVKATIALLIGFVLAFVASPLNQYMYKLYGAATAYQISFFLTCIFCIASMCIRSDLLSSISLSIGTFLYIGLRGDSLFWPYKMAELYQSQLMLIALFIFLKFLSLKNSMPIMRSVLIVSNILINLLFIVIFGLHYLVSVSFLIAGLMGWYPESAINLLTLLLFAIITISFWAIGYFLCQKKSILYWSFIITGVLSGLVVTFFFLLSIYSFINI